MSHFTDFTGYVLFIITSFLAGVESADQCLLNSKVLSCFSGVTVSITSFFLLSDAEDHNRNVQAIKTLTDSEHEDEQASDDELALIEELSCLDMKEERKKG